MMESTTPSSPKIGAVVSQAKETASALWVLLHARQCTDDNCRLLHCMNAKGIFSLSRAASTGVKLKEHQEAAVAEARKLLSHFKDCRQSRLTTPSGSDMNGSSDNYDVSNTPPACLVCSLVARARPSTTSCVGTYVSLDFSTSPYDPALPSPSLHLPLHGHGTRSGGRRRGSSAGSIDESSTSPPSTSSSLSSSSSSSSSKASLSSSPQGSWKIPTSQRSRAKRDRGLSHSDTPTLGPTDGDWGFGSLDMAQASLPAQADGSGGGSRAQGRHRSSSLSALPLTSEDQVGASVLSSFFSSSKPSLKSGPGAKRPRSVSWGNELGGRTDDTALGTPNWMLNGRNSSDTANPTNSATNSITNLPSVGHIASFRRPLVSLSRPTSSSPPMGPRSPPSLAKLADAVDRSIRSPTSMLGYIQPHHQPINPNHISNEDNPTESNIENVNTAGLFMPPPPSSISSSFQSPAPPSSQSAMSTTPPTSSILCPSDHAEEMGPYSPHKELSLMKLADVVLKSSPTEPEPNDNMNNEDEVESRSLSSIPTSVNTPGETTSSSLPFDSRQTSSCR